MPGCAEKCSLSNGWAPYLVRAKFTARCQGIDAEHLTKNIRLNAGLGTADIVNRSTHMIIIRRLGPIEFLRIFDNLYIDEGGGQMLEPGSCVQNLTVLGPNLRSQRWFVAHPFLRV